MRSVYSTAQLSRLALAAVAILALSAPASGAIIVTSGNNNSGTDNVLFNAPGLANDALVVEGIVNGTDIVQFTGTETLHGNGGQARIEGFGGAFYDYLEIEMPAFTFTKLVFNLNTPNSAPDGTATFTVDGVVYDVGSNGPDVIGNGENFFTIEATGGMTITRVVIQINGTELEDTRQIRIGGVSERPDADIPEPGTLVGLGLGLCGLAFLKRRS
jgi:hypothetical protein